jgi:hypothetical protein
MKQHMDREQVLAWKARWDLVNAYQELEQSTSSAQERERKWNVLETMLKDFDWVHARPEQRAVLLKRWKTAAK